MTVSEEQPNRIVIRDNDYYGGSVHVENPSRGGYPVSTLTIVWEAYQGGGARIELQSAEEMEAVGNLCLRAAEEVDPGRIERGPSAPSPA